MLTRLLVLVALLLVGAGLGRVLAELAAPDSEIAAYTGLLTLPLAFFAGALLWLGVGLFAAVLRAPGAIVAFVRRRRGRAAKTPAPDPRPDDQARGSIAFVFASLVTSLVGGLVVGALATELGFWSALGLFALVGWLYGTACWLLARSGLLSLEDL